MTRKRTTEKDVVVSPAAAAAPRRKASRPRSTHSASAAEPVTAPALETAEATPSATTSSVTTVQRSVTIVAPAYEDIALLAYSYWEARGCRGGSPEEDWLRAESEIRGLVTATL